MGAERRQETQADDQIKILNQIIGKSLTKVDASDYVHTFVSTRSLRKEMFSTINSAILVAPSSTSEEPAKFKVLTHEGTPLIEHTLENQECSSGSLREFIRSENANDSFFGYLCQSQDGKNMTFGFYRFEAQDTEDKKLKTIAIRQLWLADLVETGLTGPIKSVAFTRSMSSKLKVAVATGE